MNQDLTKNVKVSMTKSMNMLCERESSEVMKGKVIVLGKKGFTTTLIVYTKMNHTMHN